MKLLTIFTPTYNRANTLPRLYDSLTKQTVKEFVWLIVDDGSVDNTREMVEKWQKEKNIDIQYIHQPNGGKMRAHNTGVKNCETNLFVCVDSDDYLVENGVELILNKANELLLDNSLSGIVAYKGVTENKVIGNEFPNGVVTSTLGDLYRKGFKGDTTLIFKTEILKAYLFPEIENEKFITEDYVYCQIDEKYKMKLLPEILIICEYLDDGYTKNALKLILNNPKGSLIYFNLKIKLSKGLRERISYVVRYTSFGKLAKSKNLYRNCNCKFLYVVCYPLSFVYYMKKRRLKNATR